MSPESRDHSPSTVEELTVLSDRVRVLTAGESTGGRYEVFEVLGTAGGGAPLHSHPWDEDFYVLEGTIQIVSGGKMRTYGWASRCAYRQALRMVFTPVQPAPNLSL